MAMGRRKRERQDALFIASEDLPRSDGHPFYQRLNALLEEAGFDDFVEEACRPHYREGGPGQPSIPPGVYFRMLMVGYFEGLSSQRGIGWRVRDSLSVRAFVGVALTERTPDHSSLTRIRDRLPMEVVDKVFAFALKLAADKKLLTARSVGVDSTMLEADAAMKSIVRREGGDDYRTYVRKLAAEADVDAGSDEAVRQFDRTRKKSCSNEDWESKTDPHARIAKMKDGRTHMAYKAEHAVALDSEFMLAARVLTTAAGDASTITDTLMSAQIHLDAAATLDPRPDSRQKTVAAIGRGLQIKETAADSGYHKLATIEELDSLGVRPYLPERRRPRRGRDDGRHHWSDRPPGQERAYRLNKARMKRAKAKALHRRRGEVVERSFAHVCNSGGARRTWLKGLDKINRRYVITATARNLGLIMLKLFGVGKPRSLQHSGGLDARGTDPHGPGGGQNKDRGGPDGAGIGQKADHGPLQRLRALLSPRLIPGVISKNTGAPRPREAPTVEATFKLAL